jgi:hypothetical protein
MGSYCLKTKTTHEILVDDIFASFVLRKSLMEEIIRELQAGVQENYSTSTGTPSGDQPFVTETNFQTFFNQRILNKEYENYYHDYRNIIFSFWFDFYRKKPYRLQFPFIKFTFALLSKSSNRKSESCLIEILEEFGSLKYKNELTKTDTFAKGKGKPEFKMPFEELKIILIDYIYSISLLTVEHFKNFSPDPKSFRECLLKLWDFSIIEAFVVKTFFNEDTEFNIKIPVTQFIRTHLGLLKDDNLLRRKLTDFSLEYRKYNEEKFQLKEYNKFDDD